MEYEPVIGLEVHAQLKTATKIFCGCSTQFGNKANQNTCPVCLGLPGVLPVLNKKAVDYAIRAGLALDCKIAEKSVFARKNYFYPDLPKGYQISQFELPLCEHGHLNIDVEGVQKKIGITRIHMEEDAGKLLHEHPDTRSSEASWVDLNRACVPLIEIVSEPDIRTAKEAVAYLKKLRSIVRYLDICDGNLEEGSMRCDANVSVRPQGQKEFGTRAEIKNINSFKNVEKAIYYEIDRQVALIEEGGTVVQETRLWNADKGLTRSMRSKEEANDYRYFPDPDLLPLKVSKEWIDEARASLPELQSEKSARFQKEHGLSAYDADVLTQETEVAHFFEEAVALCKNAKKVSNWIQTEIMRLLNDVGHGLTEALLRPTHLAELIALIEEGSISNNVGKDVLSKVFATGKNPQDIVEAEGLKQVSDTSSLDPLIDEVMAQHPNEVQKYKEGKTQLIGFFVGKVMKASQGQANPKLLNELFKKKLG
jgi:aspartyl-tRNA(Asn)/glutamyl-tRNA(Gln) amidotransferase subunit B